MTISRLFAGVLTFSILSGCTGMKIDDFKNSEPAFVLEEYFAGEVRASGMFEDRFGIVRRQFTVDIKGAWDGKVLILDERFHYSDGEKDRRVWTIEKTGDTSYVGRADDVIGLAHGEVRGNALNWRYDLKLKVGDGIWRVHFDDWMFLQSSGLLLNRARVSKLGIDIGTVTLAFMRAGKQLVQDGQTITAWPTVDAERRAANQ
tara:strand:- start:926 stop:1534 length:609 start_codon:yes stop_codon:yes gene_type:complete